MTARLPPPLLSRCGNSPARGPSDDCARPPLSQRTKHIRCRARHVKKIELRWIRAPETGCTTASPHRPESLVTHSVKQILSAAIAVSNQKKKSFRERRTSLKKTAIPLASLHIFNRSRATDRKNGVCKTCRFCLVPFVVEMRRCAAILVRVANCREK
jgi:hypothetical protein